MVTQYPDTVVVTIKPTPIRLSDGNYTPATGSNTVLTFTCRAETNSVGQKLSGPDGALLDYSFTLYMPKTTVIIPFGASYSLTKGAMTVLGKVRGSSNGQFNSRIWV